MFWRKHSFLFNILDKKNVISSIGKKRFQSTPFAILHKKLIQKVIYAKKVDCYDGRLGGQQRPEYETEESLAVIIQYYQPCL